MTQRGRGTFSARLGFNESLEQPCVSKMEPTVLYIMGYGRSGSTVLDILLGNHNEVVSTGSLINLPDFYRSDLPCACGQQLTACSLWSRVLTRYCRDVVPAGLDDLTRIQKKVETRKAFPRLIAGAISAQVRTSYQRLIERLFVTIGRVSQANIIVDSSKSGGRSIGRALALARFTDLNVKVVFLVRDGRGVMWSALKGPGSPERGRTRLPRVIRALRAVVSWSVTNAACIVSARLMPSNSVVLVRYEDLVANVEGELERIGKIVPFDATPLKDMVRQRNGFAVGHNIAGNRLRFAEEITIKPDLEWQDRLPRLYSMIFWILGGPLALAFGYRPGRTQLRK